jgi:hypothetical protein
MTTWLTNLKTDYIRAERNPYQYQELIDTNTDAGLAYGTYKATRSAVVGIVNLTNSTGVQVYIWLYKLVDITNQYQNLVISVPGYFYKFNHTPGTNNKWKKYNASTYGTKNYNEVVQVSSTNAGAGRPTTSTSTPNASGVYDSNQQRTPSVSSSTTSTYSSSATPKRDTLTSWMQAIAGRPYTGDLRSISFAEKAEAALMAKGYSRLEAQAYLKAKDDTERGYVKKYAEDRIKAALDKLFGGSSTGGSGGSGNGSSSSSNGSNTSANYAPISFPDVQTKLVVRMPSGFQIPNQSVLNAITVPAINQTFLDESGKIQSYTYQFDFIPQNIQYSGLGSEWVEIPRAENFAFVDWNKYQLMKVSMSWIMALDRTETGGATVHDGMFNSVDSRILDLRRMAQRKYPVSIVNMDDLLSVKLKVDQKDGVLRSVSGMQFVITDLSVTASRRTSDPSTGQPTTPSKIAVAQCQMTLQEVPIESVQIVSLPKLNIPFIPPTKAPSSKDPLQNSYLLASGAFTASPTPPTST